MRVDGLARTRYRVVTDRMGVAAGETLDRRRISGVRGAGSPELPAGSASRVDVAPVGGGLVEVHAAVLERPLMPTSRSRWATLGVRALVNREATWRVVESDRRLANASTSPPAGGKRDLPSAVALSVPLAVATHRRCLRHRGWRRA